jgi:hypothetical protein
MSRELTRRGLLGALLLGLGACQRGSELERWAFDRSAFDAMPKPSDGDWLSEHAESGQSFEQYLASRPNRAHLQGARS